MLRVAGVLRGTGVAVLLCIGLLVQQGPTQNPPSSPVPSNFFGMHVEAPAIGTYPAGPWPNVTAGALAKGSFIVWPYIQGDSQCKSRPCNTFNWAQLDAYVSLAASHGIDYLYAFDTVPMWAVSDTSTCFVNGLGGHSCTGMVANTADWDNYVTALVTRYDGNHGHGRISAYDLWNEPDESLSFTGTVANMVTLTQHSYNIIRSINPTAVILSPSGGSTYMDSYWAAGGLLTVDAVNFHAYPDTSLQANDVAEKLSGYLYVTSMKPVFAKYGLSNKPVWDSEGSWGCVSNGAITDPTLRSAFIVRWYLEHWSLGIARSYWYDWDDNDCGTLAGSPTAPGIAYQQVYNWMVGTTMTAPGCAVQSGTIWSCGFTRPGGYQALVIWNTAANTSWTAPSQYTGYRDLQGNVNSVPSNHAVTIGPAPILLENRTSPNPPTGLNAVVR